MRTAKHKALFTTLTWDEGSSCPYSVRQALAWTAARFEREGLGTPRLDAEMLLAHVSGTDRLALYRDACRCLTPAERRRFLRLARRRLRGEPLAYIVGSKEFWSLDFRVNRAVLIPRPETELLVETALQLAGRPPRVFPVPRIASRLSSVVAGLRILDVGTGSGILAVVLARELPACRMVALDRSWEALRLARENARAHGVLDRMAFVGGDIYAPLKELRHPFHLIVSNPPYVCREDLGRLPREIRDYEPRLALDGGPEGLEVYRRMITGIGPYLAHGGFLLLEVGFGQAAAVGRLVARSPSLALEGVVEDLAGIPRVVIARDKSGP